MKNIIHIFYLILIFFCFVGALYAQTPEEAYRKANLSYEDEDYEGSSMLYETLVRMDRVSPEVFYNLGNSYFKLKNIGKAVLNYERASRLAPRDRDIKHNMDLARGMAIDKIELPERGFILDAILFPYDRMNINELCVLVSIMYLSVILLLMFSIFFIHSRPENRTLQGADEQWPLSIPPREPRPLGRVGSIAYRRRIFYIAGSLVALCIVFIAFLASKIYDENLVKQAVIISREVGVRSGPKEDYLLQFTLHEGTEVRIVEERDLWYEISISEDLKGWIPKDAVEAI